MKCTPTVQLRSTVLSILYIQYTGMHPSVFMKVHLLQDEQIAKGLIINNNCFQHSEVCRISISSCHVIERDCGIYLQVGVPLTFASTLDICDVNQQDNRVS